MIRHGKHQVWRLKSGARFTMPRTGSERRGAENGYHTLRKLLAGELAPEPEPEARQESALRGLGGAARAGEGSQGSSGAREPLEGDSGAGAPTTPTTPTTPAREPELKEAAPAQAPPAQGAWAATIAQAKALLEDRRAAVAEMLQAVRDGESEVKRLEAFLESLQLSADAYRDVAGLLPAGVIVPPAMPRGQRLSPSRYISPKGLPRRVLLEVLTSPKQYMGFFPFLPVEDIVKEFKRRGHITSPGALQSVCFRELPGHGGAGEFEWVRAARGVRLLVGARLPG